MKRILLAAVLFVCGSASASAQTTFGGGLVFTDLDPLGLGFQVNAYVGVPAVLPGLRIGGDFTYFLPEKESVNFGGELFEAELNLWEVNGNVQYDFLRQEQLSVYGLGGVNISRVSGDFVLGDIASGSESDTKVGLNLGAGLQIPVGFGAIYGEAKYVVADDDMSRFVFGAGVRIGR
jgi:opacity protein-like surface antigen